MKKIILLISVLTAFAAIPAQAKQSAPAKSVNQCQLLMDKQKLYSLKYFVKSFDTAKDQKGRDKACTHAFFKMFQDADKFKTSHNNRDHNYPVQLAGNNADDVIYLSHKEMELFLKQRIKNYLSENSSYGPDALNMISENVLSEKGYKQFSQFPTDESLDVYPMPCGYSPIKPDKDMAKNVDPKKMQSLKDKIAAGAAAGYIGDKALLKVNDKVAPIKANISAKVSSVSHKVFSSGNEAAKFKRPATPYIGDKIAAKVGAKISTVKSNISSKAKSITAKVFSGKKEADNKLAYRN